MIRARLKYVRVRGFRRFQHSKEFVFKRPDGLPPEVLIIAGPNGSGKSSLLEAILFALGKEHLIHRQLDPIHRRQWFQRAQTSNMEVRLILYVASAPGTLLGTRTPCEIEIVRTLAGWSISQIGEDRPLTDDKNVAQTLLEDLPVEWFSSWRHPYLSGPIVPMAEVPTTIGDEAARLWLTKQRIANELTRMAFLDDRQESSGPAYGNEWLSQLAQAWSALIGQTDCRFAIFHRPGQMAPNQVDFFLQKATSENYFVDICSIDQLSAGELEWLALAGTLITAKTEGMVLIDEPELHLNPEWQIRILSALRQVAPDVQFIIASHSVDPWDQSYSYERLLLVPADDPRAESQ